MQSIRREIEREREGTSDKYYNKIRMQEYERKDKVWLDDEIFSIYMDEAQRIINTVNSALYMWEKRRRKIKGFSAMWQRRYEEKIEIDELNPFSERKREAQ